MQDNAEFVAKRKTPRKAEPENERERLRQRVEAATEITALFKLERYVYISCCGFAVLLLFFCAIRVALQDKPDYVSLGLLFGSSGIITFSIGRLIFMWNRILEFILTESTQGK